MLLSLKFSQRKDFTLKVVTAKNQDALKSIVNAIKVELLALAYACVKDVRIVKTGET